MTSGFKRSTGVLMVVFACCAFSSASQGESQFTAYLRSVDEKERSHIACPRLTSLETEKMLSESFWNQEIEWFKRVRASATPEALQELQSEEEFRKWVDFHQTGDREIIDKLKAVVKDGDEVWAVLRTDGNCGCYMVFRDGRLVKAIVGVVIPGQEAFRGWNERHGANPLHGTPAKAPSSTTEPEGRRSSDLNRSAK